jgi:hypothetical protein
VCLEAINLAQAKANEPFDPLFSVIVDLLLYCGIKVGLFTDLVLVRTTKTLSHDMQNELVLANCLHVCPFLAQLNHILRVGI